MSFRRQEFPANTAVVFKMISKLFDAAPEKWEEKAKSIAMESHLKGNRK